jgi:hypothetical protein
LHLIYSEMCEKQKYFQNTDPAVLQHLNQIMIF